MRKAVNAGRPETRVLFVGAGKRLSLLERFIAAGEAEGVLLSLSSVESREEVPIRGLAQILEGPRFDDPEFDAFLLDTVARLGIDIVIPNMDRATVILSRLKDQLQQVNAWAVVSSDELCVAMEDKQKANAWFESHGIPTPCGDAYPMVIKDRFGFGAKNQITVATREALDAFFSTQDRRRFFVQPYVEGQEFTVDAYVDRSGKLLAALSRKRLEVSGGEVQVSETFRHEGILALTRKVLAEPGWQGPITLQFIDSPRGLFIIEINPRFGGGVTHSIHCGLDFPRWILREHLSRAVSPFETWPDGSLMTRALRDIFHDCADRS